MGEDMRLIVSTVAIILLLMCGRLVFALEYDVVDTVENQDIKMDGVAWDGKNIWVITYRSSPIVWKIAKLDPDGSIAYEFEVPVNSLDDIHNFGMTNITSDGKFIWANQWNEGLIYKFTFKGKQKVRFGIPSVSQLIPVGIAWDGKYLWVLHWSNKNLYKLDKNGKEIDKVSLRKISPPPDMGLAWDGTHFWVGTKGANRVTRITPDGEVTGYIKGPQKGGGIRDIDWDGEHLLLVYQQGKTIYKLKIKE
jgi:sugar lactone lactonase YvrE